MQTQIVKMINDFEHGRLSRRQLIAHLTGLIAASLGATVAFADQQPERTAPNPEDSAPTFETLPARAHGKIATGIIHAYLRHGGF